MATRLVNLTLRVPSSSDAAALVEGTVRDIFRRPRTLSHVAVASTIARTFFGENLKDFSAKSRGGKDRWGAKWPDLAASTIQRKAGRKQSFGRLAKVVRKRTKRASGVEVGRSPKAFVPINVDTGRLIKSLTPSGTAGQPTYLPRTDQIATVDSQIMELGTEVPYAKYVQRKRPVLMETSKAAGFIATGLADGLVLIFKNVR